MSETQSTSEVDIAFFHLISGAAVAQVQQTLGRDLTKTEATQVGRSAIVLATSASPELRFMLAGLIWDHARAEAA